MTNFYKIAGVTRENVWIQRSPPGGDAPGLELVCLETNDLKKRLKEFARSNLRGDVRFHEYAIKAYGIDFTEHMSSTNL